MANLKTKLELQVILFILFFLFYLLSITMSDDATYMAKLAKALTPTPSDWSPNTHFCSWYGIQCDDSNHVVQIWLESMLLKGILPSDLTSLSHLTIFFLQNNSLYGPLPSLTNLTMLKSVDLSDNNFTSIPNDCFNGLTSLQNLSLTGNNNLAPWTFPTNLTRCSDLIRIELESTNIMGSLPDIFDLFQSLNSLFLSHNNLIGGLPQSLARSKIQDLRLDNQKNGLSGTLEMLSWMTLFTFVALQNNRFNGSIPDLSNCTVLQLLHLHDNNLTGVVPSSLMELLSLTDVSLGNNKLQGPVPVFGKKVSVNIGGTNSFCQANVGPCDPRVTILLEIAAAFGYPVLLADSWLGNNPCDNWSFIKCQEEKIISVNLAKQNLTGTISPAFSKLTDLRNLNLSGNSLMGSIPSSLTTLPQLETLDVSNNNLSGVLPKFLPRVKLNTTGNALLLSSEDGRSETTKTTSLSHGWIVGATIAIVGLVIFMIMIICNRKKYLSVIQRRIFKKPGSSLDHRVEDFINSDSFLAPKRYNYSEVKRITNSFRNKLGQGGFGVVYKAILHDGRHVAVKVITDPTRCGEEFLNEVASISKTSHVNIVTLLGFCYEKNKKALIYEFMPNGSLDKFIYKRGSPNAICNLDWNILYKIAVGVAQGLEYLHRGCNTRILHFDIKPQNILLDEEFCPKISDFGLAKLCKKKESIVSIRGTRGTIGYIAPEVFSRTFGRVSHKSDVFSYGMLIIEMVGGRKNYASGGSHSSEMFFPDWIYKDIEQGNIPANCFVNTEEENDMVLKMTLISLWCIQTHPSERPSMSKVVDMFEGPLQSVPYPPKPVLNYPKIETLPNSDLSSCNMHETNSITIQEDVTSNQILSSTKI